MGGRGAGSFLPPKGGGGDAKFSGNVGDRIGTLKESLGDKGETEEH